MGFEHWAGARAAGRGAGERRVRCFARHFRHRFPRVRGGSGMKAVFSFWSKPFSYRPGSYGGFVRAEDFLRSWTLAVQLAARHYKDVTLVTDSAGKALLQDALAL